MAKCVELQEISFNSQLWLWKTVQLLIFLIWGVPLVIHRCVILVMHATTDVTSSLAKQATCREPVTPPVWCTVYTVSQEAGWKIEFINKTRYCTEYENKPILHVDWGYWGLNKGNVIKVMKKSRCAWWWLPGPVVSRLVTSSAGEGE